MQPRINSVICKYKNVNLEHLRSCSKKSRRRHDYCENIIVSATARCRKIVTHRILVSDNKTYLHHERWPYINWRTSSPYKTTLPRPTYVSATPGAARRTLTVRLTRKFYKWCPEWHSCTLSNTTLKNVLSTILVCRKSIRGLH